MNIWLLVCLAVAVVLTSILVFRLHAFLTLLLAGLLVAALTGTAELQRYTEFQIARDNMTVEEAEKLVEKSAPARLATSFGETAGKIGILIALASIIGQCLLESGAASTIVERMLQWTGPKRAPEALAASSFVLGIPVFFDTVFYLMIPLARSLRRQTGGNYVLYILAILAGGSIAHSLVPPTPGPLMVAGLFNVDIGTMMIAGLAIGGCSSVVSLASARVINRLVHVPLRFAEEESESEPMSEAERKADATNESMANTPSDGNPYQPPRGQSPPHGQAPDAGDLNDVDADDAQAPVHVRPGDRPNLFRSLIPIALPVVMISVGSIVTYLVKSGTIESSGATQLVRSLGDKNIALAVGVVFALSLLRFCPQSKRGSLVTRSLAAGGNIILITAAGGAFGAMLRQAGIEEAVGSMAQTVPGLAILPVAFAVTAAIRTLQGSATVAMITAAGILQGFAEAGGLPFHPVYLAMAIGAGSKPVSWMTDSAFWVITRMSGMTEGEGLRVISPMSTCMGLAALLFTMLFAWVYPAV